jgi:AhpD family alkylhydroperoxidase
MPGVGFENRRFDPDITTFHPIAKAMAEAFGYTATDLTLDPRLAQLVRLRVAQINSCSYCLILHAEACRTSGINPAKIDNLGSWWESDLFDHAERAALAYCDALTVGNHPGFGHVHDRAAAYFDTIEIAELAAIIINMNVWTRLKLAQGATPVATP